MYLSQAEKRAALLLCLLALAGAGLRLTSGSRRALPFQPLPADSAALGFVAGEIEIRKLPLDLNTASAPALERLEGIGPELARRIVEERLRGGPYKDLDGLASRVRGVGAVKAGALEGRVTFSTP